MPLLLNHHSEEAREILGRLPKWIIRSGITVIFIIFLSVFFIAYYIQWPDVVSAPLTVTTLNPPVTLLAGTGGKIDRFLVKDGDTISAGQDVVVFEDCASYEDICALEDLLKNHDEYSDFYLSDSLLQLPYELGHLQSSYMNFCRVCLSFQRYIETARIEQKKELLCQKIEREQVKRSFQQRQYELSQEDKIYEERNYRRDSLMFTKYQSIARTDLERSERSLLSKEISLIGQQSSLFSGESAILDLENQLVDLDLQHEQEIYRFREQIAGTREQVLQQIHEWHEHFVISSPISGRVVFPDFWSENQSVEGGGRFATVIPLEQVEVLGRAVIPSSGIAKVQKGQQVDVKLNSFPFMEYGVLRGEVRSISEIPDQDGYVANIVFPDGLVSSFGMELTYIQEMNGTAEIITREMRLIHRFFQPLRSVISNGVE